MIDEQDTNTFDKIRARADEKRQRQTEEKRKTDEFFKQMKKGDQTLNDINRRMKGEIN